MMFRRSAPFPAWKEALMHEMAAFGDRARGAMAAVAVGNPLGVRQKGRGRGQVARRRRYRANRRHRRCRGGRIAGDRGPRLGRGRGSGHRARGYGYRPDAPESVRGTVEEAEGTPLHSLVTDVRNRKGYTLLTPKARLAEYWCAAGVKEALRTVVEGGGDTDGAAVGAVEGAGFGLKGIPWERRDRVREIDDGRTPMEGLRGPHAPVRRRVTRASGRRARNRARRRPPTSSRCPGAAPR